MQIVKFTDGKYGVIRETRRLFFFKQIEFASGRNWWSIKDPGAVMAFCRFDTLAQAKTVFANHKLGFEVVE